MDTTIRLVRPDDLPPLVDLIRENRDFLAPFEPVRDDAYFTLEGHGAVIGAALERHEQGTTVPYVILESGRIVGRITLNEIVRGPLQSCSLGYWVSAAENGRGIATAAARAMTRVAFDELGLHRVQAGTLLHNVTSQRVLERTGFIRYGVAPQYLNIAGTWQDHALYQLLAGGSANP
jgi:ribosomal-protein-alanine N-acetyltransferase